MILALVALAYIAVVVWLLRWFRRGREETRSNMRRALIRQAALEERWPSVPDVVADLGKEPNAQS